MEQEKKSVEKSPSHNNAQEPFCTLDEAILSPTCDKNETQYLNDTAEKNYERTKFYEQNNIENNTTTTDESFQIPIIVVPPKEYFENSSIQSEPLDLPIIYEAETEVNNYAIENCPDYSKENGNDIFVSTINSIEESNATPVSKNFI